MAYDLIKEVIDEVNLLAAYGQCGETHPCLHAHVCVGAWMQVVFWVYADSFVVSLTCSIH